MRCSNCSYEIKPVVAIDIDGTLADYHGHFIKFAEDYMGVTLETDNLYAGGIGFKEWFCVVYETDERTWRDIKLAYRQGGMKRSAPVYPGARRLVDHALSAGAEVWLTTTRPYLRLDGIDPDTRFWLDRHHISYDGLLYDEDKYKVLAERIDQERVVMVLDDLPEQYDAAVAAFGKGTAVLRRSHYNMASHRPVEVLDLFQAAHAVENRIDIWRNNK